MLLDFKLGETCAFTSAHREIFWTITPVRYMVEEKNEDSYPESPDNYCPW